MSSHKKYIKELKPITFITFDSNTLWDIDNGNLLYGEYIPDESENGDPIDALLHSEYIVNRSSYSMGQPSMIVNSPTDNYSIVLAPYEKDDKNEFPFSKSWIEIPYNERLRLNKSFSISFIFNKAKSDSFMRNWIWSESQNKYLQTNNTNGYNYIDLYRTIFRKGNKISLTYVMPYYYQDYLSVVFPNNSTTIQSSNMPGFYNRDINVTMTHDYIVMDDGRYYTLSRLYWDNRVIYEYKSNPVFGDYDGGNTSSFEIGGNQDSFNFNSLNDRATSTLKFDQFAVFDYALQPFQISDIYKKIYPYEQIVTRAFPTLYYQFNERDIDSNFVENINKVSNQQIRFVGSNITQIDRGKAGIHGVYGSTSVEVKNKGMLYCKPYDNYNYNYSFFNPNGDFTIDFFAMFTTSTKGILLSIQDDIQPFRGLCLFVNCKDNIEKRGILQLSISENQYITTPEKNIRNEDISYNDGEVRHYAIRRINNYIELWINAVLIDRIYMASGNLTNTVNQLYMFGLMPGNLTVDGSIQHMACYARALSQQEIEMRSSYMVKYNIRGRVTVQGIGQTILMRVYSFNSGALIVEQKTGSDGNYNLNIPSDDYINVVAMDVGNINIRPRILGPLLPDTYEDLPWDY